jgi:hypothetical protein
MFSAGGLAIALLLVIMGVALTSNANFAKRYVRDQLSEQKITFKAESALTEEERKSECVVKYAGQALTTGKQAECYANDFIGLHVKTATGGKIYAELGGPQAALRTQVAEAKKTNAPNLEALEKELADITATRETAFKGETLRGLLLTSFGFSEFGRKGGQAAAICFAVAGLMILLSAAGFVHARRTPRDEAFAPAEPARKTVSV